MIDNPYDVAYAFACLVAASFDGVAIASISEDGSSLHICCRFERGAPIEMINQGSVPKDVIALWKNELSSMCFNKRIDMTFNGSFNIDVVNRIESDLARGGALYGDISPYKIIYPTMLNGREIELLVGHDYC